jgi:TonB family protein
MESLSPEDLAEDMQSLKGALGSRTKKSSTFMIWRVAAGIALLGVFSFMIYYFIEQGAMENERALSVADSVEVPKTDQVPSNSTLIQEDSVDMLAYKQQSVEPAAKKMQQQDHSDKEETSAKIVIDEQVVEEKPAQQLEKYLEVADLEADLDIDNTEPNSLEQSVTEEEVLDEVAGQVISEITAAPAIARVQQLEANNIGEPVEKEGLRTIRGVVRAGEDNAVVPGVNVILKGTSNGTITDLGGNFTLDIPTDEQGILVFSYIGLRTEEIEVNDEDEIEMFMESDLQDLAEVVVIAKGKSKSGDRSRATGAVKAEEMLYTPPKPNGGEKIFKEYIKENIRYPESGKADKIRGTVVLNFKVDIQGQIIEIDIEKSLGEVFDQEAIRLLREGPEWEPARENASAVAGKATVKIRFRPKE